MTKVIVNVKVKGWKWHISKLRDENVERVKVQGLKVIFSLIISLYYYCPKKNVMTIDIIENYPLIKNPSTMK